MAFNNTEKRLEMKTINNYRQILERKKAQKVSILGQIKSKETELKSLYRDKRNNEEAQNIIQAVARQTQSELEYHISELVSLAMNSVLDEQYSLKVDFVSKADRTEAHLKFICNENEIDPMTGSGGGSADIASFALRIAAWNLPRPRPASVIVLDEPFKHVSRALLGKCGELLSAMSKDLGLQIIMTTHSQELVDVADKVFSVGLKKGISQVEEGGV